jgi:nucleotide-binding universal stress UspA family protein
MTTGQLYPDPAAFASRVDEDVLAHVLCAVDDSPGAHAALHQAASISPATNRITVLHVDSGVPEQEIDRLALRVPDLAGRTARLERVPRAPDAVLRRVYGDAVTLTAAGATRFATEDVRIGHLPSVLLGESPTSVLLARGASSGAFPQSIAVGFDGLNSSREAVAVALAIARRSRARIRLVLADRDLELPAQPVEVLASAYGVPLVRAAGSLADAVASTGGADLLAIGSGNLRFLGHVARDAAVAARCSVLVVRVPRGRTAHAPERTKGWSR